MDEAAVRENAEQMSRALVAGDVERAMADVSDELRRNIGEVVGLLPLPVIDASVESIERGGSSVNVVIRLVGETDEMQILTRWKDRDGEPRIVEASHLSRSARPEARAEVEAGEEGGG